MTLPRRMLVSEQDTPYYHIVSRCVRRAFLCGTDPVSGQCYEHRRQWVEDRIRILSSLFAVDVCAYAVMSNHYHIVIKLNGNQAKSWSDLEVANRWTALFKGPIILQNWLRDGSVSAEHQATLIDVVSVLRQRLSNLSWFMKCLNEPIARQANKEDHCTGHFWEARFKSQAIRNNADLMACMTYVDLNPVRAGMADSPETSEFTSFRERVELRFDSERAIADQVKMGQLSHGDIANKPLQSFESDGRSVDSTDADVGILPFSRAEYFQLVDWTGRIARDDKRGQIQSLIAPIMDRLQTPPGDWLTRAFSFEKVRSRRRIGAR